MKHGLRIGMVLTVLLFLLAWGFAPTGERTRERDASPRQEDAQERIAVPDAARMLRVKCGEEITEMTMEEYLVGVLRAEMPASFELEALKAQTIAARTYTIHKMLGGPVANHPDADACDDVTCCKAFASAQEAAALWGAGALYYEEKLTRAVRETDGRVLVYDGSPVLAVFFSSSDGHTQGAGDVWQSDLPYLQSVESPETEALVPNYYSTASFSAQEFRERILAAYPQAELSGNAESFITSIARNDAGYVASLCIGGITLRGNDLRTLLGLRSPCFTVEEKDDTVIFHVTGYGHGVGMSQYGANAMAGEGKQCDEILTHYFTGAQVVTWDE